MANKIFIYNIQMVYFFKEESQFKNFDLSMSLYQRFKMIFKNSEPQTIPIPDDAPPEVLRCVWNDINTKINFSKQRLELTINIPTELNWKEVTLDFNNKISAAVKEIEIEIDRVGIISEMIVEENLQSSLHEVILIDKFRNAKESNISWRENIEYFNIWTYISMDNDHDLNKIVFDINTLNEHKLSQQGSEAKEAIAKCLYHLERKMQDVL